MGLCKCREVVFSLIYILISVCQLVTENSCGNQRKPWRNGRVQNYEDDTWRSSRVQNLIYIKENSEGEKLSYVRKNNGETTGFRKKRKKTEKRQISEI